MELRVFEVLVPVLVILSIFYDAVCGVEFPRDQREIEFPPTVPKQRASSTVPIGHLRPFGYQRKPEGRVFEYNQYLHPAQFHETHVSKRKPLVFRNAILESPALTKWSDEYLLENYGDLDVIIERKKENREVRPKRMKFAEFLKRYKTENLYIVSLIPQEMSHEVKIYVCGTFVEDLHLDSEQMFLHQAHQFVEVGILLHGVSCSIKALVWIWRVLNSLFIIRLQISQEKWRSSQ